jgi:hypothetical protein
MKIMRIVIVIGGLVMLVLALGFTFRLPFALSLWPWEDGRYSYLFIGSILAAVSAAALWIGGTGELAALPAGSLNVFVIAVTSGIYFLSLIVKGRSELVSSVIAAGFFALTSAAAYLWSRRLTLTDMRPTPRLVRVSFGIFIVSLILAGGALILRAPVFPWKLNPDSSVVFGCIFVGDAFYFLYALIRPRWGNAAGQLLSFLAYDLVLIFPFIGLFNTIEPGRMMNLIVYVAVLIYSGALAMYYLIFNPQTRFGSR